MELYYILGLPLLFAVVAVTGLLGLKLLHFADRLTRIQRFMPKSDVAPMIKTLQAAAQDKLNGAKGVYHFYKTNGTLTTFYMHFYYLHNEGECQIFYGSVQNITKLSNLEKQVMLLSRISADTVLGAGNRSEREQA